MAVQQGRVPASLCLGLRPGMGRRGVPRRDDQTPVRAARTYSEDRAGRVGPCGAVETYSRAWARRSEEA